MSDPERRLLRPAEGRLVRHEDPDRGHVAAEGELLPLTAYYARAVLHGDLIDAGVGVAEGAAPERRARRKEGEAR